MRLLYLRAIPVGVLLLLLAIPGFVALAILALLSVQMGDVFEKLFPEGRGRW